MPDNLRRTWWLAAVFIGGMTSGINAGQQAPKTAPPAGSTVPTWTRQMKLPDGRTFISDGSLAIDAALAKPAAMPSQIVGEAGAKVIQGHLTASLPNEYGLAQLVPGTGPRTYVAPSGIVLNANYVEYLARTLPAPKVRLRMKGDLDPIVILLDGKPVGLVMAMRR